MRRVRLGRAFGPGRIVEFLRLIATGDSMIFQARELANARRHRSRAKVFHGQIESDVAIKIAIGRIARITFRGAPDLPAGIAIARKYRRARRRKARRIDGATRTRLPEHQAMRIDDEPAQVRFLHDRFQPRRVGAFRQPESRRITAEYGPIDIAPGQDLGPHRFRRWLQERKQTVRGRRRHDLEASFIPKFPKLAQEIAPALQEPESAVGKSCVIKFRKRPERFIVAIALYFARGQVNRAG